MNIAIQNLAGSFTDRWQKYFTEQGVGFTEINIFDSEVLTKIKGRGIDTILFDVTLYEPKNRVAAQAIVPAIERLGVNIFPGSRELWCFDDKVAQKYLFESLEIPCCPTTVFYNQDEAKTWARQVEFPKVFKLKSGAGSANVVLLKSAAQAERIINQMFGPGICAVPSLFSDLSTKVSRHRKKRDWGATLQRLPSTIVNIRKMYKSAPRERGYVYFQEFLPNNEFDTRVTVIGNRAFAFRRMVRTGDFRASGSGNVDWSTEKIDPQFIRLAFEASAKMDARCMAYDLIYDLEGKPAVIECCYKFVSDCVYACQGYWDQALNFHSGHFYPQDCIAEDLLAVQNERVTR